MADEPRGEDTNRRFWQQVAQVTEGSIEPPKDGWQKISRRIDAERRPVEPEPPPPSSGGIHLPSAVVWIAGLFALVTLFVITSNTRPLPGEGGGARGDPPRTGPQPADPRARLLQIEWQGAVAIRLKDSRVPLDFRLSNIGTGRISLPGPGSPTTTSPHYLLEVSRAGEPTVQVPLVADAAELLPLAGAAQPVADLALDLSLAPGESLRVHVMGDTARVFPRGLGLYQLRVQFLPPSLSEKSSPPDTTSPLIEVAVAK